MSFSRALFVVAVLWFCFYSLFSHLGEINRLKNPCDVPVQKMTIEDMYRCAEIRGEV